MDQFFTPAVRETLLTCSDARFERIVDAFSELERAHQDFECMVGDMAAGVHPDVIEERYFTK